MKFLNKLKDIAAHCSFSNKDKVIKFLFLIHNTNERVKDYWIEHMKPENTLSNALQLANTVESTVQMETLSMQLLQNVGKLNQTKIHSFNKQQKHGPKRGPNPNVTTIIAKAIPDQVVMVVDVLTVVPLINQNSVQHM